MLLAFLLLLCRCGDDRSDTGAYIEVKVVNMQDAPILGRTVYMSREITVENESDLVNVEDTVSTDGDGKALFLINFDELDVTEGVTRFYFTVFYNVDGETFYQNSAGVTVRRGQTGKTTIKLPVI